MIRVIGDVHGKYQRYKSLIADVPVSRQLGDMGVGFFYWDRAGGCAKPSQNPPFDHISRGDHKFLRGNHDNPGVCRRQSYWIPDGTIEVIDGVKIMYVGGAVSVDRGLRAEGFDWWPDEELSYGDLQQLCDVFGTEKPDIMMSHDCPESIAVILERVTNRRKCDISSRTRQAFDSMLHLHQPKLWCFGHWHRNFDQHVNGTRFICLPELAHNDLDLGAI